ncbi:UDP-N-acetylmuramoyl-tripeptide--D-alanyl-D-alanine ligase [Lentibacillus sp. JNUCC-1]|uniref:UDP-N-acetylmuramoyl-tripeptide--D-alanyl-D- alanine ligase n=1 Tax=Lentibacillus sp. JNUCC-1 TaxID=2654513 RepID=UPI0012E9368B|nr:UDP-N-acetylmuramoyl-tripeptide--D-alanyl-D-alanine ligase [Lentibacillus sp. JNUCC-1]MUV36222.1 UDP-N-acetylmuramoyl-tripeptide--D-alanyl-D-alanine ligase [Lentibacillus sp. JNUCC-1]
MLFTTEWAATILKQYSGKPDAQTQIEHVTTNSKESSANTLFIPIVGERFDGHQFMEEAFNKGAVAAVWQEDLERPEFLPDDFPLFLTTDTTEAMQTLASAYRILVDPVVVGVTGSNGKTTTKDMIAAVGKTKYKTHHTLGNYNNGIGLPLTILSMPAETELLVLEMGMDRFGEIEQLSKIAQPDIAVITNIGESHMAFLGSREGIAQAKMEIIIGLKENGLLVIDGDEPLLTHADLPSHTATCGFGSANDWGVSDVEVQHHQTVFTLGQESDYTIPLLGKHHALNAAFAARVGEALSIPRDVAKKALKSLEWTAMRFELLKGQGDVSVINDAYNASPTSMKAAIEVVNDMKGFASKVLVLGDMFELGEDSKAMHRSVTDAIDPTQISAVFTLGEDAKEIIEDIQQHNSSIHTSHAASKYDMIELLSPYLNQDSLILFKASRGMQFETMIERLIDPS